MLNGNVKEEHQAYAEAKRLALLALVPRPDNPRLLGELAIAEAGLGESEERTPPCTSRRRDTPDKR